ncbi:MAG: hypothetical protein ACKOCT_07430 [Alphaproteobacteria bacterium]
MRAGKRLAEEKRISRTLDLVSRPTPLGATCDHDADAARGRRKP